MPNLSVVPPFRLPVLFLALTAVPAAAQDDPLLALAARHRVEAIASKRFLPEHFWGAVAPALGTPAFRVEEVGRSGEGRPIRTVTFGRGPTRLLLWSQMHGDESSATMALADILGWMADSAPDPRRDRIAARLTVVMLPMLNPDGAARFRRENAWGIDVNRDARRLVTPEAQTLERVRDAVEPHFAFNLHDQSGRSRVGRNGMQAAFALLAPAADSSRAWTPTRQRARRLAAVMAGAIGGHLPGRVARYDDTWSARAFGDAMQASGASTVLLETGQLAGDPEKQRLRALNVVALVTALEAIAANVEVPGPTAPYDALPQNASTPYDLLVVGGTLQVPGLAPVQADLGFVHGGGVGASGLLLEDVGDLRDFAAIDTVDATGLVLVPSPLMLEAGGARRGIRLGAPAQLDARRGEGPGAETAFTISPSGKELP
ncbi:MAG TPA: M14 family zinc carboxypeptidase [Gemmatimonadales bacterium]|nr:M14 family zinc carboxypeptidase [Gemmatimonadales bacterium]